MDPQIRLEVSESIERFRFHQEVLEEIIAGPVVRLLARKAIVVETAAKRNASQPPRFGPNTGSEPGHGPAVRTGRLRGSITWRLGFDVTPYADIGSAVHYAPYVELGTSRMDARPFLRVRRQDPSEPEPARGCAPPPRYGY